MLGKRHRSSCREAGGRDPGLLPPSSERCLDMDRAQGTPSSGVHRPGQRQHAHPAREPQQAGEDGGAARRRALGTRDALPRSQAQQHPGSCRGDAPHHLCSFSLQTCHHGKGHMLVSEHRRVSATGAQRRRGGGSPVLLPEAGRAVRRRSKSENSSASVSKPPATAVPLVLGLAGDPPQGSEKAGAGAQGSEARGPLTGAPPSEPPHGSGAGPSPAAGAWVPPQGSAGGPAGAAGLQGSPEAGVGAGPPQGSAA